MKIIYSDENFKKEIENFANEVKCDVEFYDFSSRIEKDLDRRDDIGMGAEVPGSFVDFGGYILGFFLESVTGGVTYDLVKYAIRKLIPKLTKKTNKKYKDFLIFHGNNPNEFERNIYFYLPIKLKKKEIDLCLDEIQRIINLVNVLRQSAYILGSLRFHYVPKKLRHIRDNRIFVLSELSQY